MPPYFAYIARAFLTLEGIGLQNDPMYAIVGECLPYVSQRLLTDPDPRVSEALRTFIYGPMKDSPLRAVDTTRLEYLTSGFSSYSDATVALADMSDATAVAAVQDQAFSAADVERGVKQLADILLVPEPEPTPLQAIVEVCPNPHRGGGGGQNTESSATQHAKGRTSDCPGPRKGATTRRNVAQGAEHPPPPFDLEGACPGRLLPRRA